MTNKGTNNTNNQQQEQPKQQQMTRDEILNIAIELSDENKELTRKNSELSNELKTMKSAVLSGNLAYAINSVHGKLEQQNAAINTRNIELNRTRQEEIASRQQAEYDKLKEQVLAENPAWQSNLDKQIEKVNKTKDYMLKKIEEFYLLEPGKAAQYFNLKHSVASSAVKHLINEHTETDRLGKEKFLYYECNYCHELKDSLSSFERHCHEEGDTHHDANVRDIESEAQSNIAAANMEFLGYIERGIHAIRNREHRARLNKQYAKQEQLKKELPFVE